MQNQLAAMQAQQALTQAGAPTPAGGDGGADMMQQLDHLTQLKNAGAMSDQEFAAAKAKLLGM